MELDVTASSFVTMVVVVTLVALHRCSRYSAMSTIPTLMRVVVIFVTNFLHLGGVSSSPLPATDGWWFGGVCQEPWNGQALYNLPDGKVRDSGDKFFTKPQSILNEAVLH